MVSFLGAIKFFIPNFLQAAIEGVSEGVVQTFDARLQDIALFGLFDGRPRPGQLCCSDPGEAGFCWQ